MPAPAPTSVKKTIAALEHTLAQQGTPVRAAGTKAYLKSDLKFLGASVPAERAILSAWLKEHKAIEHDELMAVVAGLWASPYFELRHLSVLLLEKRVKRLSKRDLPCIEQMVRESKTWALVDELAVHVAGVILQAAPDAKILSRWAKDDDFWVRRTALLAPLKEFRAGGGDWALWCRHADAMLEEKEFFVRKAIGWVLRERCKSSTGDVVAFVRPRAKRMSGLTFREATRSLPSAMRAALVEARG